MCNINRYGHFQITIKTISLILLLSLSGCASTDDYTDGVNAFLTGAMIGIDAAYMEEYGEPLYTPEMYDVVLEE